MQDVFVQLLRHQTRLTEQYPSSLLYRIATNVCLNRIRTRQRRREVSAGDDLLSQIAIAPDPHSGVLLDRLFQRHPDSTRVMAVMRYVDGMTLEQVARECRMSVSGVRKRLEALRKSVRDLEKP